MRVLPSVIVICNTIVEFATTHLWSGALHAETNVVSRPHAKALRVVKFGDSKAGHMLSENNCCALLSFRCNCLALQADHSTQGSSATLYLLDLL